MSTGVGMPQIMSSTASPRPSGTVPVRTIAVTIGMVLATALLLLLIYEARRVVVWIVIAAFFTGWVQRHLRWMPRTVATLLVFLVVVVVIAALVAAFALPLAREGSAFAAQFPQLLQDARTGRGPVGSLLERTHALTYVEDNQARIRSAAAGLTTPAAGVLRGVAAGVAGAVTVFVLAVLMVLEGPKVVDGVLGLIGDPHRQERVRRVGSDCAKSITGYISGNLLISVICGA